MNTMQDFELLADRDEEIRRLRADFNDCNQVRAHWQKEADRLRAENAELLAALEQIADSKYEYAVNVQCYAVKALAIAKAKQQ